MAAKPRLLDLFCGAGGAAMGSRLTTKEEEVAWAAGFFDGEGSISIHHDKRKGRNPGLHLDIEQTDERPIKRFQDAVGGRGRITLRPSRAPNRKPLFRLYMSDKETREAIPILWNWLSDPKREQIVAALRTLGELP